MGGELIVVPRPADGVCWLAEVAGTFEIVDAPDWTDDYLALRQAQGLEVEDESSHVGDVVQGWAVHDVRPVPFSRIPRWIMAPMLSRATFGRLKGYADLGLEALPVLARLYAGEDIEPLVPTTNVDTVARRLLTYVGPSSFEHLCVALLQLENPHERWWHIGGSGDGGVDGLGTDEREATIGLLQCKWRLWWAGDFNNEAVAARGAGHRYVLASLMHPADCGQDSAAALIFWGRSEIAALVVKHRAVLPLAKSLRISG